MRSHPRPASLICVASLALSVGLTACAGAQVDKTGAPVTVPAVLRIGAADPTDSQLAFFVDAVDRGSGHRLRVEVERTTYYSETPGGEGRLAGDVQSGKVALAYLPSRDWAATGDAGFQALHAPFLVSTTAAAITLARGPVAAELLAGLDSSGVHGLALIPGEARRLISRRPVATVEDLAGAKVRISDSPQSAQLISALGATPVQGLLAVQTRTDLGSGRLDAVETSPAYVVPNSYNASAPYLSSFAMFPKLQLLLVNGQAWGGFSTGDQAILRAAAADTLAHASDDVPARETAALSQLCDSGTVVVQPADAAFRALVAKAGAAQPQGAQAQTLATKIAGAVSGSGPQARAAALPANCRVAATADEAQAVRRPADSPSSLAPPSSIAPFPVGIYEVTVTAQQWAAAGIVGPDWQSDITFTWTFKADGTVTAKQEPDFPDQGPGKGTWTVNGDQVTLVTVQASDPGTTYNETLRWSYFKGELHFVVINVQDDPGKVFYALPWRKVG